MSLGLVDNEHIRKVWTSRALCISRQGKTGDSVVGNMRDCEPGLQASIWLSIAESSPFKEEQLNGFNRALGILRNEDSPELVETLLSYAKWTLQQGLGFAKVRVTLEEAEELAKKYIQKGWEEQYVDSGDEEFDMEETKWNQHFNNQKSVLQGGGDTEEGGEVTINVLERSFKKQVFGLSKESVEEESMEYTLPKYISQRLKQELWVLETCEKNVKIFEQLFRLHSMKAMISGKFEEKVMHLHLAGVYMKWSLNVTFERYIQLLRDKMEQPGSLTQGESILASKEFENPQKSLKSKKNSLPLKNEITSGASDTEEQVVEKDIQVSNDYEQNLRLEFPVGLLNLISNNKETNIICKESFSKESLTFFYLLNNIKLLEEFGIQENCDVFILVLKLISQAFFKYEGVQTLVVLISAVNARKFKKDDLSMQLIEKAVSGSSIRNIMGKIKTEIELNMKRPQFMTRKQPPKVPFDPQNVFFIITHLCEGLLTFDRFTEAFKIIKALSKLPLNKVESAREYLSAINLLFLKSKYLMNDFKEVWGGLARGLSIPKSLPQLLRFNQFVGNFLLEQKIEDQLEQMICQNNEFGVKMRRRAEVDLNEGELTQFYVLMDCLEIRMQLKRLGKRFEELLNDQDQYSLEIVRQRNQGGEGPVNKGRFLGLVSENKKRRSCMPNLEKTQESLLSNKRENIKRQLSDQKAMEQPGESLNSFEILHEVKVDYSGKQSLDDDTPIENQNPKSSKPKMIILFETQKVENITTTFLSITEKFFHCISKFKNSRNLSLLTELNHILWESYILLKKVPRLNSQIRKNLISVAWRFWSVTNCFEKSQEQFALKRSQPEREININKFRIIRELAQLVDEEYLKKFSTEETLGEEGKEKVYVRNVDVEMLLNFEEKTKGLSGRIKKSLLEMMETDVESGSSLVLRSNVEFWNRNIVLIWNKGDLYDEEEEEVIDGFFREDLKSLLEDMKNEFHAQVNTKESANTEEVKNLHFPLIGSRHLEMSKNMNFSKNNQELNEIKSQRVISQLSFAQVAKLPGGVWYKLRLQNDQEFQRATSQIQRYKEDLFSREMPQILEHGVKFFTLKQEFYTNYLRLLFFEKQINLKNNKLTKVNNDRELFLGLTMIQNQIVKQEMFNVFSRVISENNKPLGLLKLLEKVKNEDIKKCLLNNFKFLEIFSPEEFNVRDTNFHNSVTNYNQEAEHKFGLLNKVLCQQSKVKTTIQELFDLCEPNNLTENQSKTQENKKEKNSKKQEKMNKKNTEGNREETESSPEHGLVVVVQFDPSKDSLWVGLKDVETSKCLVKELKNENVSYLSLKKIQLELQHIKYLLKQNIFHSTCEFQKLWESMQSKINKLQAGAYHFLYRVDLIIAAFLKSLEMIHLHRRGLLTRSKDHSTKDEVDNIKKTKSRDLLEDQQKSMTINTLKQTRKETYEETDLNTIDLEKFKKDLRKNLFLFWDFEFMDIDLHKIDTLSQFQQIYRDFSFEMFLRRFTTEEAQTTFEKFKSLSQNLCQLKDQTIKNGAFAKEKSKNEEKSQTQILENKLSEIFRAENLGNFCITKENNFFLAFNGKSKQNSTEYVKQNQMEEQLKEGIISINLGGKLKQNFKGLDSSEEVIEIYDLKKALNVYKLLTIHSVEPSLNIIPWETLLNFFLTDKFVPPAHESDENQTSKHVSDSPLTLRLEEVQEEPQRCPILFVSDRVPFSRKSFYKYPPIEKKYLLSNTMQYARDSVLLFSFLGSPVVMLGKINLPIKMHEQLLDRLVTAMETPFETFHHALCESKEFLDHFFFFGISLKPFAKL